jgi:hypothetical protein
MALAAETLSFYSLKCEQLKNQDLKLQNIASEKFGTSMRPRPIFLIVAFIAFLRSLYAVS